MNNKKTLLKFEIYSSIFAMILGTILHFTYDFFNKNLFIATFSSVNESTWEHLKLIFFPLLITTIIGFFKFRKTFENYICGKTIGILSALSFTTIFFYSYTGIIGTNIDIINIASFFIAIIIGEIISYNFIIKEKSCNKTLSLIILGILLFSFIVFTFAPPKIGLFKDPINGSYGITFKAK